MPVSALIAEVVERSHEFERLEHPCSSQGWSAYAFDELLPRRARLPFLGIRALLSGERIDPGDLTREDLFALLVKFRGSVERVLLLRLAEKTPQMLCDGS